MSQVTVHLSLSLCWPLFIQYFCQCQLKKKRRLVQMLQDYTNAIITAHVEYQCMRATWGPGPDSKCSKTVYVHSWMLMSRSNTQSGC